MARTSRETRGVTNMVDGRRTDTLEDGVRRCFGGAGGTTVIVGGAAEDGWRAALGRTLAPGDRILAIRVGPASSRWAAATRELGFPVETLDAPWGEGAPMLELARRLEEDKGRIRALFVMHTEPSTGACTSIAAVREAMDAADHDALLLVDTSAAIAGTEPTRPNAGIDIAVTEGSRGFVVPTGLTVVALSGKALGQAVPARAVEIDASAPAALIADLRAGLEQATPAVLSWVQTEHRRFAEAVRAAVRAWGLSPWASDPRWQSPAMTAVRLPVAGTPRPAPQSADGVEVTADGTVVITHRGLADETALLARLDATERTLRALGLTVPAGAGRAAAAAWLRATGPMLDLRAVA